MPQQRTGMLRKSRDSWQWRSKSKKQNLVILLFFSLLVVLLSYCVKSNEYPAVITRSSKIDLSFDSASCSAVGNLNFLPRLLHF